MSESPPSKIPFDDFLKTCIFFYMDHDVENKFNKFIDEEAKVIINSKNRSPKPSDQDLLEFLIQESNSLKRILRVLELSDEKFMRIISLIRYLDNLYDWHDWNIERITKEINKNNGENTFAKRLVKLLLHGYNDSQLKQYIPQIHLERLKLITFNEYVSKKELIPRLKRSYYSIYTNMKGKAIEDRIKSEIKHMGYTCDSGRTELVDTIVDVLIPNKKDP